MSLSPQPPLRSCYISMEASDDTALDLRKTKLTTDQTLAHSSLSSLSLDFSPSRQTESQGHSFDFPALLMAQDVLTAAFNRAGKPTRPFKAYPKNPLSLTVKTVATETLDRSSNQAYLEFRQRMLIQMVPSSKRPLSPCHVTSAPVPGGEQDESRDNSYWQRRRKNNEAAKRSRDTRRAKEDEIAIRAAFLEQENLKLKCKVVTLTNELTRLRYLLYST